MSDQVQEVPVGRNGDDIDTSDSSCLVWERLQGAVQLLEQHITTEAIRPGWGTVV
jgi:hypothetical protein